MDLISQLQTRYAQLPAELKTILESDLRGTPLSVAEAHALSQLSQIGFVGVQNITTPVTPIGLHGELIPFLDASHDAMKSAQQFYAQFRTTDTLLQKLPDTRKQSDQEYETELMQLIEQFNQSCVDLYRAEEHVKAVRKDLREVIQKGHGLLTHPFNNNQGVIESIAVLPSVNNLIPGLAPSRPDDVYFEVASQQQNVVNQVQDGTPDVHINAGDGAAVEDGVDVLGIDGLIKNDSIIVQYEPISVEFDFEVITKYRMASRITRLVVSGFSSCPYFQGAKSHAQGLSSVNLRVVELDRSAFHEFREQTLQKLGLPKDHHKTCPLTYLEDDKQVPVQFLGGFDALKAAKL